MLVCSSRKIKKTTVQGAKKVIFTACHSGKLKLTFTSPNVISTSPKNVLMSRLISQFFCNLNSSKKFTCQSGKLITEFTSLIAKSTSTGAIGHYFLCMMESYNKMLIDWVRLGWKGKYLVLCQDVWPRAKYFPDHTSHSVSKYIHV